MYEREEFCKLITTKEGITFVTMPDGSIIPRQLKTVITQDIDHGSAGLAKVMVELIVNMKPEE